MYEIKMIKYQNQMEIVDWKTHDVHYYVIF